MKLEKRSYSYTFSWKWLKSIGIDLGVFRNERTMSDSYMQKRRAKIVEILKVHMPEMIRITGYDVCCEPMLTLDYFQKCLNRFMRPDLFNKPRGNYRFDVHGYRVLVDDNDTPITNMRGIIL